MEEYDITYKKNFNSHDFFVLNHIKRYTNNFSVPRRGEIYVPENTDYHMICAQTPLEIIDNGTKYSLTENSFFVYSPFKKQEFIQYNLGASYVHCIFSGYSAADILSSLNISCYISYPLSVSFHSTDEILYFNKKLEYIMEEKRKKKKYYQTKATGMFIEFLSECAKQINPAEEDYNTKQIKNIVKYIRDHVGSELDINKLVDMSNLSRSRFYHLFKQYTGMSPIGFQNSYLLNVSKDYLRFYDKMTISDIARKLGFNDSLYFSRLFKKEYGISPKEYRKQLNKPDI